MSTCMLLLKFPAPLQWRLEIITMDGDMYKMAMNGCSGFKQYGADRLALEVTPNGNTVLHVAAEFGSHQCVEDIVSKCPSLLNRVNNNGDTPLHSAFAGRRYLAKEFIQVLISTVNSSSGGGGDVATMTVREMLRVRNNDGDTPLHLAARRSSTGPFESVLSLLMKEDTGLDHGPNNARETPLYLYVERGSNVEVLSQMLETYTILEYGGPRGRTALHAAVIRGEGSSVRSKTYLGGAIKISEPTFLVHFLDKLIKWKKDLIKEPDEYGWTPLHYAAENEDVDAVKMLIHNDKSVAYVTANDDEGNTALHMATAKGNTKVMDSLLLNCPDCWEMVNSKGQNILHIAVNLEGHESTNYISKQPWVWCLVNRKDHEGNTPMHVIAQKGKRNSSFFVQMKTLNTEALSSRDRIKDMLISQFDCNWILLQKFFGWSDGKGQGGNEQKEKQKEGQEKGKSEIQMVLDTVLDHGKEKEKAAEEMSKMAETHMLVATLISTITFAAGFTIPGGYHGDQGPNQGTAVLVREAAFKAFVITNTIALICSTSSVFLYVSASLFKISGRDGGKRAQHRYAIAFWLILIAMLAMMVAFSTGAYAVLAQSSGLAIATCAIACSPFIIYSIELKRHFAEEMAYVMDYLAYLCVTVIVGVLVLPWVPLMLLGVVLLYFLVLIKKAYNYCVLHRSTKRQEEEPAKEHGTSAEIEVGGPTEGNASLAEIEEGGPCQSSNFHG